MNRLLRLCFLLFVPIILVTNVYGQTTDFSANTVQGCSPVSLSLTDLSTGGPNTWSWKIDGPSYTFTSSSQNVSTTLTNPGLYTVRLIVTRGGIPDTMIKTDYIAVFGKPVINSITTAPNPASVCLKTPIAFSSNVTLNSTGTPTYSWTFGDGSPGDARSAPTYTYLAPGSYTATLSVVNGAGCPSSGGPSVSVTIYPLPVADFSISSSSVACSLPAAFTFTNTSVGGPYAPANIKWEFPSGNTTGSPVNWTFNASGTYGIKLKVIDSKGCISDSTVKNVDVYGAPATFTRPTKICEGMDATFTCTTPGVQSGDVNWDFGDGSTANGTTVSHNFPTANNTPGYNIKMSISFNGICPKVDSFYLPVHPKPVITVRHAPDYPCPAPVKVALIATSSVPNSTFTWNFFDGGTGSGSKDSAYFTTNGWKQAKVKVSTQQGCMDSFLKEGIPVLSLIPDITASPDSGCRPLDINFDVKLYSGVYPFFPVPPMPPPPPWDYPVDDSLRDWTFNGDTSVPGPGTSTLATPSSRWTTIGDHIVSVANGLSKNGCPFTYSRKIHVDDPVPALWSASNINLCPKKDTLYVNILSPAVLGAKYSLTTGDTTVEFEGKDFKPLVKLWFKRSGAFEIKLSTDFRGCGDDSSRPNYVTVYPAVANFTFTTDCPASGLVARFTNITNGGNQFLWDFGDGNTSTLRNPPPHTYTTTGNYKVKLTAWNTTNGCVTDTSFLVRIFNTKPTMTYDRKQLCAGEEIRFTGNFNVPVSVDYAWVIDNLPATPFDQNSYYTHLFSTAGWHTARLITRSGYNSNCYDTVLLDSILVSRAKVGYTVSPPIGCTPFTVTFTDTSKPTTTLPVTAITNRDWSFGDGTVNFGNVIQPTRTYTIADSYYVKLIVTDALGCRDSVIKLVQARKPVASFTSDTLSPCIYQQLTFKNKSTGATKLSYRWDFGDGTPIDTNANARHGFSTAGFYTIRLIVTDASGCSDTMVRNNYIQALGPRAGFTMSDSISACGNLQVNFTNTSTGVGLKYSWDLGKGSTPGVTKDAFEIYTIPQRYTIILRVSDDNNCVDTFKRYAYVLGYNGGFSYTPTQGCTPLTVNFTPPVNGIPKIFWDFGDGIIDSTVSVGTSHTYTAQGSYIARAYYSTGPNCKSPLDTGLVAIQVDKVRADFSNSIPCVGVPFTLSEQSGALFNKPNRFFWKLGPAAADTAAGPGATFQFNTAGNHPVTIVVQNSWGCKDTLTKNVFINPLPDVDAGPADTGICPGDQITLHGRGAKVYEWSPAALVSCTLCDSTVVSSALPTTYYLKGTDANGCINYDSITARIQIKTTANVKPGGEICFGETFRLEASGATVYRWSPIRFLDSPNIASPLAKPIITTSYVVEAQEGTCLVRYDTVTVVVRPIPHFDAGPDEIINYGESVELHPTKGGIDRVIWRQDSTLSCWECFYPIAKPTYTRRYYAIGYSEYGCEATDSVLVRVRCNGDSVFIPNTFSPNGDGMNDVFYPRGKGIDDMRLFRIFNRWGELVYERTNFLINDPSAGWDGTYKGQLLAPDVYFYSVSGRCESGEPVEFKGDVTLLR